MDEDGDTYYYNNADGSSTWELPPGMQVANAPPQASSSSADTWVAHVDEDGDTYYYNAAEGSSSWELPPGVRAVDETAAAALTDETAATAATAAALAPTSTSGKSEDVYEDGVEEVWLNSIAKDGGKALGECVGSGDVVLQVPRLASEDELQALLAFGLQACEAQRERSGREVCALIALDCT